MNKANEIREQLVELTERVRGLTNDSSIDGMNAFLKSAVLRIWAGNKLYADIYAEALDVFEGEKYSAAQIITALGCAGEKVRELVIPSFFQKVVDRDIQKKSNESRELIEQIGRLLASFALINGDFTLEEASVLHAIMNQMTTYCDKQGVSIGKPLGRHPEMITPVSQTGYYKSQRKEWRRKRMNNSATRLNRR